MINPVTQAFNIPASSTAYVLVSGQPNKRIRVYQYIIMAGGTATNVTFNSASTPISMLHACAANGGVSSTECSIGWFNTNAGEGLTVTTGSGSSVGMQVVYEFLG